MAAEKKLSHQELNSELNSELNRKANRKNTGTIHIESLFSLDQFSALAREGKIVNASSTGFLLHIEREDFVPKVLRDNLNADFILGENVKMLISEMNLEMDGEITRTKFLGKGLFEIAIDFTENAPEYWRECLVDLLPNVGEFPQKE